MHCPELELYEYSLYRYIWIDNTDHINNRAYSYCYLLYHILFIRSFGNVMYAGLERELTDIIFQSVYCHLYVCI